MEETRDVEVRDIVEEEMKLDGGESEGSQGPLVVDNENLNDTSTGMRRTTPSRKTVTKSVIVLTVVICMIGVLIYAIRAKKRMSDGKDSYSSSIVAPSISQSSPTEKPYIRLCDVRYNNITRTHIVVQPSQSYKRKRCQYESAQSSFMECAGRSEASSIRMKTETMKILDFPLAKEIYLLNNGARVIFTLRGDVSCVLIRHKVNEVFRRHSNEDVCNYSKDTWIDGRKRRELLVDTSEKTTFHEDGGQHPGTTRMTTDKVKMSSMIRWSKDYVKASTAAPGQDDDYDHYNKFMKKISQYSRFRIDKTLEYFELC